MDSTILEMEKKHRLDARSGDVLREKFALSEMLIRSRSLTINGKLVPIQIILGQNFFHRRIGVNIGEDECQASSSWSSSCTHVSQMKNSSGQFAEDKIVIRWPTVRIKVSSNNAKRPCYLYIFVSSWGSEHRQSTSEIAQNDESM